MTIGTEIPLGAGLPHENSVMITQKPIDTTLI